MTLIHEPDLGTPAVANDHDVTLTIDGLIVGRLGYGGVRTDVTAAHPGFPDSDNPGYAAVINFSNYAAGDHVMKIEVTDLMGHKASKEVGFHSAPLVLQGYVFERDAPAPMGAQRLSLDEFVVSSALVNASIGSGYTAFDLYVHWNQRLQNFDIRRVDNLGFSGGQPPAVNAASNLTAVEDAGAIRLDWDDNSSNEDGFYIHRRYDHPMSGIGEWERIAIVDGDVTTFSDQEAATVALSPGEYVYEVRAFSFEDQANASNFATFAQTPAFVP